MFSRAKQSHSRIFSTIKVSYQHLDIKTNKANYIIYIKVEHCKRNFSCSIIADMLCPGATIDVQNILFAKWQKTIKKNIFNLNLNKYNIISEVKDALSIIKQNCHFKTTILHSQIAGLPKLAFLLKHIGIFLLWLFLIEI